jgi:hypothetical protein
VRYSPLRLRRPHRLPSAIFPGTQSLGIVMTDDARVLFGVTRAGKAA